MNSNITWEAVNHSSLEEAQVNTTTCKHMGKSFFILTVERGAVIQLSLT